MAEIGLGKGAGAGSFASGFGRGLSQALLLNRQRSDEKSQEERARKDRLFQTILPVVLQNMEDPSDLQPLLESQFPDVFTQAKRGGKKGESPFERLTQFLGPLIGMRKHQPMGNDLPEQGGILGNIPRPASGMLAMAPSQQPEGVSGGTLGNQPVYAPTEVPPDISQTPLGGATPAPAAPAQPTHRTLFGVPMLTPEERIQREASRGTALTEAEIQGKVNIARKLYGQGVYKSMEEALGAMGLRGPASSQSAEPFQPVYGVDAAGKEVAAVFDQNKGLFIDPISRQPIPGFKRAPTVSATADEYEKFLASYAKDKGKTVDQLSTTERLDARSKYAKAGSTAAAKPESEDPLALARLAVRQPQILQGLTPTVTSGVMAAIASDPQLSAQYEFGRMEPIRSQAQSAIDTMKDLVVVDEKTGKIKGLTPGAAGLYGVGPGRVARFVPGSQTATAKAALDQITGELTLDMLKEMKAQSRTGATGFGQLSGRELDVLQSAATVLKGEISADRALQELKKLYERFNKVLLPGTNEMAASAGQPSVGPITLDTPVFIGPDGKPRIGAK